MCSSFKYAFLTFEFVSFSAEWFCVCRRAKWFLTRWRAGQQRIRTSSRKLYITEVKCFRRNIFRCWYVSYGNFVFLSFVLLNHFHFGSHFSWRTTKLYITEIERFRRNIFWCWYVSEENCVFSVSFCLLIFILVFFSVEENPHSSNSNDWAKQAIQSKPFVIRGRRPSNREN